MISVVIPTYNRCDAILALLSTIYQQTDASFEVLVIDDSSNDSTVDAIRREYPATIVIENIANSGPAVSRNRGIVASTGNIILGLDSDTTIPDRQLLARIDEFFERRDEIDCVAFRILKPDRVSEDAERWWHPRPVGDYAKRQFFTDYFSGTAYAIRKDSALDAGLYPEHFFMHYEEVLLAWRLIDRGRKILYSPNFVVIHDANPVSNRNLVEVYFKPRNQILLAINCLPVGYAICYVLPRAIYQLCKATGNGHLDKFFRAMRSALHHLPSQIQARRPLQPQTLKHIRELRLRSSES